MAGAGAIVGALMITGTGPFHHLRIAPTTKYPARRFTKTNQISIAAKKTIIVMDLGWFT